MKFTLVLYQIFHLLFIVQRDFLHISGILEQSPRNKTFRNVIQSSTVFHSGKFYKVLQYSVEKSVTFEKVPGYSFSF